MAIFREFLKAKRKKRGLNQSEFGKPFGIIMTQISKIETGKRRFPFTSLGALAIFLEIDYLELKDLYVADRIVDEAHKYNCSDLVFSIAESHSKCINNKNAKQGKLAIL